MEMNHFVALILSAVIISVAQGQYYSIPSTIEHTVGTTNVFDRIVTTSDQGTTSFLRVETLQGVEIISGNRVEEWRVVDTTNSTPSTSDVTTQFRDEDGVFFQIIELATSSIDAVVIHKNFSSSDGAFFAVGDMIREKTSFYNATVGDGVDALVGYGYTEGVLHLDSVSTVSTPWGQFTGLNTVDTIESNIYLVDVDTGDEYLLTQDGTINTTYAEGYGVIKQIVRLNQQLFQGFESGSFLSSQDYTETTNLKSSTYFPTLSNIPTVSVQQQIEAPFDGWVYVGEYPWIYSARTDSWYYQLVNSSKIFWFDPEFARWMQFDELGNAFLLE